MHDQDPPRGRKDRTVRLVFNIFLQIFCIFVFAPVWISKVGFCINQKCYPLGPDSDTEERCGHYNGDHGGAVGHPIGGALHTGVVVARQYPRLSPEHKLCKSAEVFVFGFFCHLFFGKFLEIQYESKHLKHPDPVCAE